ncbi:MAG TPA: GatB/YqeY domain-containing protein [Candidatus Caccopulliclostridium gallistercoris]|uniref:GatB/YqeY domain-containing protein n=1 Tax=Candidatus Caccopulliclostridium gallistercoris TaxID=2840719 RepID=A0A9D1SYT9_9FIRM|nr:GatB/YqeY domain-containing protein [Candidatus Caccopulliclostridium gallistercoris]
MIVEEIKKANVQALKDKNVVLRNIYSVVLNKIMLESIKKREKGEEITDPDVVQILQKTIKELTEEKENYLKVSNTVEAGNIDVQIDCLKGYLPEMLSEEKIKEIILGLEDKSIGSVMKFFKQEYNGKCDMNTVRNVLANLK